MGGGFGVSTSFVTALGIGGNRDGVRIVAPHDLQEHDEHKIWTKKNTWHWETGWVWHLTQGQVLHVDANLLETHINMSPIQVHMNQGILPVNLKVHWEPNFMTRTHHFHAGRHGSHFNELEQEAGEIELHAVRDVSGVGTIPGLSAMAAGLKSMAGIKPTPGTLSLSADGEMKLESRNKITLRGTTSRSTIELMQNGNVELNARRECNVEGRILSLEASGSKARFSDRGIKLDSGGGATTECKGGQISTNATKTQLNGRVYLGAPAVGGGPTQI